ncbi:MAG: hypothetical protein ACR2HR_09280 [Euzebya sp.]
MRPVSTLWLLLLCGMIATACNQNPPVNQESAPSVAETFVDDHTADVQEAVTALQTNVADWAQADDLTAAQEAAEGARNVVVGPFGPGYGDTTGDGIITGENSEGLLPGLDSATVLDHAGLVQAAPTNDCIDADVLGGSWQDPQQRWDVLQNAIDQWSPTNNPFPSLPSHLQRIVGWATLTLESQDLDQAHEFAGHAQLHVDVTTAAYACN